MEKSSALLFYALILNIPQELEYMWFKPFRIPTFLYLFARYVPLIDQGLSLAINLLPASAVSGTYLRISFNFFISHRQSSKTLLLIVWQNLNTRSLCDILGDASNFMEVLGYVGVQG